MNPAYFEDPRSRGPYRHEYKYFINQTSMYELKSRLWLTMDRDPNADRYGNYRVRSLYFDDEQGRASREKLAGVESRKKYRLRSYDDDYHHIKLECKIKENRSVAKRSMPITMSAAESLIYDGTLPTPEAQEPMGVEIHTQIASEGLKPAVIVEYIREAYIMPYQDIRICFDKHLSVGLQTKNFFDRSLPTMEVLPAGIQILEIKFNEYLPSYYWDLLQGIRAERSAVSKYLFCRNYVN